MQEENITFALLSAMATFTAVFFIYLGSLHGAVEVENFGWQLLIGWWLLPGGFWILTLILQDKDTEKNIEV